MQTCVKNCVYEYSTAFQYCIIEVHEYRISAHWGLVDRIFQAKSKSTSNLKLKLWNLILRQDSHWQNQMKYGNKYYSEYFILSHNWLCVFLMKSLGNCENDKDEEFNGYVFKSGCAVNYKYCADSDNAPNSPLLRL